MSKSKNKIKFFVRSGAPVVAQSVYNGNSVQSTTNSIVAGFYSDNGNYFWSIDDTNFYLQRHDLSTTYNVTTVTATPDAESTLSFGSCEGLHVSNDGVHVYVCSQGSAVIKYYKMTSANDPTTLTFQHDLTVGATCTSVFVNSTGTKIRGIRGGNAYEYDTATAYDFSGETLNTYTDAAYKNFSTYSDTGNEYIELTNRTINFYTLTSSFDAATGTLQETIDVDRIGFTGTFSNENSISLHDGGSKLLMTMKQDPDTIGVLDLTVDDTVGELVVNLPANFYFGNAAHVLADTSDMQSYTDLLSDDFWNFTVDGDNNISFWVGKEFEFDSALFYNDSTPTYLIDIGGKFVDMSSSNTLRNLQGIEKIYAPNLDLDNSSGSQQFSYFGGYKGYAAFPGTTILGHYHLDVSTFDRLYFANVTRLRVTATNRRVMLTPSMVRKIIMPNCDTMDTYYANPETYQFNNIAFHCDMFVDRALETASLAYVTAAVSSSSPAIGETITVNGLVYTCVASGAGEGEWNKTNNRVTAASRIAAAMNSDTRAGSADFDAYANSDDIAVVATASGAAGNGIAVSEAATNFVWNDTETSNGGGEHPFFNYLKNTRKGKVFYCDAPITQDAPTGLSVTAGSTFATINFTPPAENANGIAGYEVWIDDGVTLWQPYLSYDEIYESGQIIRGLEIGTTYDLKIRAFDNQYNLSAFTSTVQFTTTSAVHNTEIGAIGGTTNTAALLETLLGLSSGDVENFAVDGSNNITCNIVAQYEFLDDVFNGDTVITHFRDLGGQQNGTTGSDHFRDCTALTDVVLKGDYGQDSLPVIRGCTALLTVDVSEARGKNAQLGRQCGSLHTVKLGRWTNEISTYCFQDAGDLKYIDFKHIYEVNALNAFDDCNSMEYWGLSNVKGTLTSTQTFCFGNIDGGGTVDSVLDISGVTKITASCMRFSSGIKKTFLHSCEDFAPSPNNDNEPEHFVLSKATKIGLGVDYSVVSNSFLSWSPTGVGKVYVHASMETIDAGNPSADMDLLVTQGFDVVYVTDYTPPDAITDLSASGITATTFDLDFTAPSATNTLQHYDVYMDYGDGRGWILLYANEISASGGTISGLTTTTEYKVKVRAIDEFYNMSDFSNEITVTTL